jgi:type II secretory ATPase GspE/PulE/Tfp pilus assembly ATPase PilB-like protein
VQALLREKALNTGELLKQHRDLQQKLQLTQEELARETSAREDAAKEVQATKQAVAAATRQASQDLHFETAPPPQRWCHFY